ncbi:MAG: hypothetical protein WCT12_25695 [Verrucomicrobiota bacterium]
MTLIFNISKDQNKPDICSLTVQAEAIRGLRCIRNQWLLYVSDPEPMSVSRFKLLPETLEDVARDIEGNSAPSGRSALTPENGRAVLEFVQSAPFIRVELVEFANSPAMVPSFPAAGPRPNMGMKSPSIQR